MKSSTPQLAQLQRVVRLPGAVLLGLGSMVGTGVFVSIGIGAGIAGPGVIVAVLFAAIVAACNGLSSAQLAANHPVSGGTYEYGYHYLNPTLGFTAGWTFLAAKSASAATAALGFSGYLLTLFNMDRRLFVPVAVGTAVVLTLIVLVGLRRSNQVNALLVAITLLPLLAFILFGFPEIEIRNLALLEGDNAQFSLANLLEACALMFVAYTGYGRVATLGEEVQEPERTIPRAIIVVVICTMLLYVGVAVVAVGGVGAEELGRATDSNAAPLALTALAMEMPSLAMLLSLAGMVAMLGVLLNLILGLSRVVLAMGRRNDFPTSFAHLNASGTTPTRAVLFVGFVVMALTFIGDVKTTWSFSAFTVLVYYSITNLSSLRLTKEQRLYPRIIPVAGLCFCLFLAFWVESSTWLWGLGLIAFGLLYRELKLVLRKA